MAKGIDQKFVHYGIRKEDLAMIETICEKHHRLDLAVERIYRSEPFTSDEERLEHLFKLYAKMTKK